MRTLLATGIVTAAVVGAAGVGTYTVSAMQAQNGQASGTGTSLMAQNGQGNGYGAQTATETRAQVLNMTADQLRTQLQTKTMQQIAQDQGMTLEQFQTKMREMAQERWQDHGLSDEEIAQRQAQQAARQASGNCDGTGNHYGGPNRD